MNFNKKQLKVIFITGMSILFILILFAIITIMIISNNNKKNTNINISSGFSSIKEIIEHYNSIYKSDVYRKEEEFPIIIELVFGRTLYENYESNEEYYNGMINDIATYLNYTNFKMIDEENDVIIEVTCQNSKVYNISINGIDDYFIYMDSQQELEKYKEIKSINFTINAPILNILIENRWVSNTNFGPRNSIFQNYNICLDGSVEYRKIGSNVYNVIFTEKYAEPVVSNIKVGIPFSSIKETLGNPSFEDEEIEVIGYKGEDIYVFFTKNEISVYRCTAYDYTEFWKLTDGLIKEKYNFKEFMNELTYLWPDYSEYTYDSDYMFISYPNRGVDVKLNYDGISGIVLYNNISEDMNKVKKHTGNTEFVVRFQLDNVFEAEKRRIVKNKALKSKCEEFAEELTNEEKELVGKSELFDIYMDKASDVVVTTYFIPKTSEYLKRELNEPVNNFVWISDEYFVYSVTGKGIYCYNVIDGTKQTLTQGTDDYNIKSYMNFVITYDDDKTINIAF